jgi:hypothetical protein
MSIKRKGDADLFIVFVFMIFVFVLVPILIANLEINSKTIEGVIQKVETKETGEFIVYFEDGRSMTFADVPAKPVNSERYTVIQYKISSRQNKILSVREKND